MKIEELTNRNILSIDRYNNIEPNINNMFVTAKVALPSEALLGNIITHVWIIPKEDKL